MLGIVEIPAKAGTSAPYLGRGQSPALSNGVCYHRRIIQWFPSLWPTMEIRNKKWEVIKKLRIMN
jgi:hypothetical protein